VDQHSLHRVVEDDAIIDQLGDEGDRAFRASAKHIDGNWPLELVIFASAQLGG
jgi:hypothetical protein